MSRLADWIKNRIEKYEFIEGQDYVLTNHKTGKRQNVVVHDYHLTLDMADIEALGSVGKIFPIVVCFVLI